MIKDIYILHVDDKIAAFKPGKHKQYSFAEPEKFIDFVKSIKETYPGYRLRCIKNEGIEQYLRQRLQAYRQIVINNNIKKSR